MAISDLVFYVFASLVLFSSCMVILSNNTVRSILWMIVCFFSMAPIWILLNAEFLAGILILVYVGAVMVLFLFVVMMLNVEHAARTTKWVRFLPLGGVVCLTSIVGIGYILKFFNGVFPVLTFQNSVTKLGLLLYTEYLYPFEIASVILLVAIVAAINLSLKKRIGIKKQSPHEQVLVKKSDRLRLISHLKEPPK